MARRMVAAAATQIAVRSMLICVYQRFVSLRMAIP
jgi:hypothetical protein